MNTDILFQPFRIKNMTLPNRIVMAPMTRAFSRTACRVRTSPPTTAGVRKAKSA